MKEKNAVTVNESLPDNGMEAKRVRISILSDMHDIRVVPEKIKEMVATNADINICIGDAFDSAIRDRLLGDFKKDSDLAVSKMTTQEKKLYEQLRSSGQIPIRAYWMAKLRSNPEVLSGVTVELEEGFDLFVKEFERLPNAAWVYGNVEQSYGNFTGIKLNAKSSEKIDIVAMPKVFFEDNTNLGILFPSLPRPTTEESRHLVENFLEQMKQLILSKPEIKNVIFVSHEYLFKGYQPSKFRRKMEVAGVPEGKYMIPFYLPNEYRREILNFFFEIPEQVEIRFIYGHIHDPKQTTQKAIPFEDSDDGVGMRWGVSKKDSSSGRRRTRYFDMYQLPIQSTLTLEVGADGIVFNKQ